MHDNSALGLIRVNRFVKERLSPAIYRDARPLTVNAWNASGEPVPFDEARRAEFRPFEVGQQWGRPWGTTWFHVTGTVPTGWPPAETAIEAVIDLGFGAGRPGRTDLPGFQAEGLVDLADGTVVKGIEPRNRHVAITAEAGSTVEFYIEAASNPDVAGGFEFAPTGFGDKAAAGHEELYRLRRADLALRDLPVWKLAQDIWTLSGLLAELSTATPRYAEILRALESAIDRVDLDDISGTAECGREALAGVLAKPAYASAHRIHAVGHCDETLLSPIRIDSIT